ncbi:MAG: translocation/assembly module TamB domain-containing protein [Ignavibacteria bacterium]
MSRTSKKIFKILTCIIISFIFLSLMIFFFIQTETFNRWVLDFTLDKINKNSQTSGILVSVDSAQGNILKEINLKNGSVKILEDTIFSFTSIEINYDIWRLFDKEIKIENLKINSPALNLTKIKDNHDSTVWNYSKLFPETKELDTIKSEFDWGILVANSKIENGYLNVEGQLSEHMPEWRLNNEKMKTFDINNVELMDFNLEFNGKYFPDNKNLTVKNLSFNSNSDFNVKKLALISDINIVDAESEVKDLELITDRSEIRIAKAKISGVNVFDKSTFENLGDKDVSAEINIRQFNFADLKFFIPEVDMLDSNVSVILSADGKYGDINIKRLNVFLPKSEINLTGNLKNLDDPENLFIDAEIKDTKIFPEDVNEILLLESIPDFSQIGPIYPELTYTGTYKKFHTKFDIKTSGGNVIGNIDLDLSNKNYRGKIIASDLNPGKIIRDNSLKGNINIAADFSGTGFDPKYINADVKYTLGHSVIGDYVIRNSSGLLNLNGSTVGLNTQSATSFGSFDVKGSVNISDIKDPSYQLNGNVKNLNIAAITKSADDLSNINLSFDVKGKGIDPENLNGIYNFSVLSSEYGSFQTPESPFNLHLNITGQEKSIDLKSDYAEFKADGNFNIADLINVMQRNFQSIRKNISEKLLQPESEDELFAGVAGNENIFVKYNLEVKDSLTVNRLLTQFGIEFNGIATGQISNGPDGFKSDSRISASSFVYKDTLMVLRNFSSQIKLLNSHEDLKADIQTSADYIITDSLRFDSVKFFLNLENSHGVINAFLRQDTVMSGSVKSILNFYNDSVTAVAENVMFNYGKYNIQNAGDWSFNYVPENIFIREMDLKSNNAIVKVSGKYSFDSNSDIIVEGDNIKVSDFRDAISPYDSVESKDNPRTYSEGFLKEFYVNYKGTFEDPELILRAASSDLTLNKKNIGKFNINADFKNDNAILDVKILNPQDSGKLIIAGNLPYQNPLSENKKPGFANTPVSLNLNADEFYYIDYLKLIPGIPEIKGKLNGEIKVSGLASTPDLKGSLEITDGGFFFGFTGMDYNFNLKTSSDNSKLILNSLQFYNKEDKKNHQFDISGSLDFAGMKLNDVDLKASGEMVLLNEKVERNQLGVHGYILAGVGSPAVLIKGNLDKLKISGQLLVHDAKISSLPSGQTGYELSGDNFKYVLTEPDTNIVFKDTLMIVSEKNYNKVDPFEKSNFIIDTNKNKVAEFLDIDINIKTVKEITASIDFKKLSRAKLYGEFTADMNFKTVNHELQTTGNVDVTGNSFFKFYRTFKLDNSQIKFVGQLKDPELNIEAVYKGSKVTDKYGATGSSDVEVKMSVTGPASKPNVKMSLIENGSEVNSSNAQADAVSYLLFGRYKSDLSASERTSMASTVGSAYISNFISESLQEIIPFIIDAEFNYVQGTEPESEIQLMSELGEATVTVGAHTYKETTNLEFKIDYPLNKFIKANLPEKLMLEIFQEQLGNEIESESETSTTTGLKIIYKIKF